MVNQTGLRGVYDFTLNWSQEPTIAEPGQEQLGLKLVPTKAPIEVLVIDSIDRPSEN